VVLSIIFALILLGVAIAYQRKRRRTLHRDLESIRKPSTFTPTQSREGSDHGNFAIMSKETAAGGAADYASLSGEFALYQAPTSTRRASTRSFAEEPEANIKNIAVDTGYVELSKEVKFVDAGDVPAGSAGFRVGSVRRSNPAYESYEYDAVSSPSATVNPAVTIVEEPAGDDDDYMVPADTLQPETYDSVVPASLEPGSYDSVAPSATPATQPDGYDSVAPPNGAYNAAVPMAPPPRAAPVVPARAAPAQTPANAVQSYASPDYELPIVEYATVDDVPGESTYEVPRAPPQPDYASPKFAAQGAYDTYDSGGTAFPFPSAAHGQPETYAKFADIVSNPTSPPVSPGGKRMSVI